MAKQFDVKALRDKVRSTDDIVYDSFYVKEWDAELPVKTLTAPAMKEVMKNKKDEVRMMILAVYHGCETPEGEKVFELADVAEFESGKKSFAPIAGLAGKIMEISGLSANAQTEAKND